MAAGEILCTSGQQSQCFTCRLFKNRHILKLWAYLTMLSLKLWGRFCKNLEGTSINFICKLNISYIDQCHYNRYNLRRKLKLQINLCYFPIQFVQKNPAYFIRGAFIPSFIWCRRPCTQLLGVNYHASNFWNCMDMRTILYTHIDTYKSLNQSVTFICHHAGK